jgi:hypothetical protein
MNKQLVKDNAKLLTQHLEMKGFIPYQIHTYKDADGIPIHTNLTETVELTSSVLETKDTRKRNLYFTKENRPTQT